MEIRTPSLDDRASISHLEGLAFNFDQAPENLDVARKLCAFEGVEVIATATSHAFQQWFGGRAVPCSGIAAVAVLPEHRGQGLARKLLSEMLARRREDGDAISALYPANSQLYRSLGYEYGGLRPQFSAPVGEFPKSAAGSLEAFSPGDIGALRDCFEEMARHHNGVIEACDLSFWERRVLANPGDGVKYRTVVSKKPGGKLNGYASYYTSAWQDGGYGVHCKHLFATSGEGLRALLGYLRSMENSAREVSWTGPMTASPIAMALSSTNSSLQVRWQRFMSRIIDVPAALEGRGYPQALDTRFALAIDDPVLPENNGPWSVDVAAGRATVSRCGAPAPTLPIGALTALYTGMAGVNDLVVAGVMAAEEQASSALGAMFAGPAPWTPDFF